MLTDKHMYAAHKLLQKQFPGVQGCQSTLLAQKRFTAVSDEGMSRVLILVCLYFSLISGFCKCMFEFDLGDMFDLGFCSHVAMQFYAAIQIHYTGYTH